MFRGSSTTVNGLNINDKEHDGVPNIQEQDPPRGEVNEQDQAVPPCMRDLLGRPPDSPEAMRLQAQLDTATKMYEVYYAKKVENLNRTGERAIKHEKEFLLQRVDETLGLEFKKNGVIPGSGGADPENEIDTARMAVLIQRACIAGSKALVKEISKLRKGSISLVKYRTYNRRRFLTAKRNSPCFGAIQSSVGQSQQHFRCTLARIEGKNQRIKQVYQNNYSNK
ncbi:MAG: hypothetical protein EZS28_005099 [Streblomastix strix]|uniref:Uncharacterized protein n=1 Tax=Streblomastix strix TaxID=222440 RepID=A0A5J4WYU1_9EUKA|nr:MAG: hypothetical protein EZS28_005099 [Streblomastix strix]